MNAIETLVLEWVGESITSPDVYADTDQGMAPVRDSINSAIQELCMLTRAYVRTYYVPLVSGRQVYRIVPRRDFWGYSLEVWERTNHRKLEQTSLAKLSASDTSFLSRGAQTPTHYYPVGLNHLGLWPKPDSTGKVLEIRTVMIPKAYEEDTDPIHLRDAYERATAWYAISEHYAARGDAGRAQEAWLRYVEVAGLSFLDPSQADRLFLMGQTWRNPS